MYWKYFLKRIINGFLIFIIIMFIFSALFNAVSEATTKSQIEDEITGQIKMISRNMSPEAVKNYATEYRLKKYSEYKLDRPILERVIWRTIDGVTFNFGKASKMKSSKGEKDVYSIVMEAVPRTIILFSTAAVLEIFLGLWLGLKKAQKAGSFIDKSSSMMTLILYGLPAWWLGMLSIMLFSYTFKVFPSGGINSTPPPAGIMWVVDMLWHMILPLLTLVLIQFWSNAYLIRNIVLGILQEDYIMSARARGIEENEVLFGHTMKTAAPPIVTFVMLYLLASISGAILFEGIFSWPGLGNLYFVSIQQNDIPVVMGLMAVTTSIYIGGLVLLDLIYGLLDPRIKVGGKA